MRVRPAAVLIAAALAASMPARAQEPCATPALAAPGFVAGSSNVLFWTQPDDASQGASFTIEVASSPARDAAGRLAQRERVIAGAPASARWLVVENLSEGWHWYAIRADSDGAACAASAWSARDVATFQDRTGPVVEIASPSGGHVFAAESVTVTGTVFDRGVGAASVTVRMTNRTPGLSPTLGSPSSITARTTGPWNVTFDDVAPGVYTISAVGSDAVGNASPIPASVDVVVLAG